MQNGAGFDQGQSEELANSEAVIAKELESGLGVKHRMFVATGKLPAGCPASPDRWSGVFTLSGPERSSIAGAITSWDRSRVRRTVGLDLVPFRSRRFNEETPRI